MSEQIRIQHQNYEVEELSSMIEAQVMPIRRGVHVGNQEPHDLFVECYLPGGVDVLAADTINGNDRESKPRYIKLAPGNIPIAPERYKGKIVSSVPVMERVRSRTTGHGLGVEPLPGEAVEDFHMRAIAALEPNNEPILVSKFFAAHRQLYERVMHFSYRESEARRAVNEEGSLRETDQSPDHIGIFGLVDETPANEGLLPSLNAMMAMDMLTAMAAGSDASLHLGGSGMAAYSKDILRMFSVRRLAGKVASEAGISDKFTYLIADISNFNKRISLPEHISQHELLRQRGGSSYLTHRQGIMIENE
jgi:hypothetical protein